MAPPRSVPIFACVLLSFFLAATLVVGASPPAADETCVPSLQRMLSCLDFIEHRSDSIPVPCCIQVKRTVAEQPCCLMHVVRGNAGRLIGPEYDNTRAMVNVTMACLGDASVLTSITRNCSGKPLPPLTPEFTFTTGGAAIPPPPPSSSGATTTDAGSSVLLGLLATVFYGAVVLQQNYY